MQDVRRPERMLAYAAAATLLALVAVSAADRSAVDETIPGESGVVVRVLDGDTIDVELDGGDRRRVRLVGVDAPELGRAGEADELARRAARFVESVAAGRRVTLERDALADTVDDYGRLLRVVRLPDGTSLNLLIVRRGYARALTRFPLADAAGFRRAESAAAALGLGLWDAGPAPRLGTAEAARYVGRRATVCGRVASTRFASRLRGRPTFLNLDRPFPDQPFTVVIWGDDRPGFGEPERELDGRSICVTGRIDRHRGVPQIELRDPSQLDSTVD